MSEPMLDLRHPRRIHLAGIGGAGMSGLARLLLQRGHAVSGSDLRDHAGLAGLRALGAEVHIGHAATALGDAELVVRSTAVPDHNPEVAAAIERGMPVLARAALLAALMEGSRRVLVAGTHGKTTTTSMLVVALQAAGVDPSFAIGGQLNETGSNAHAGTQDVFVAEADESDGSFLAYTPDLALVTNVEHEHHDHYATLDDVDAAFAAFLARRPDSAPAVVCGDDPGVARLLDRIDGPVVRYGRGPDSDVRLVDGNGDARVRFADGTTHALEVGVPGAHNRLNATATMAAVELLGADRGAAIAGLAEFVGAQRRFQRLGTAGGVTVVDDYAHHPTELSATLAASRALRPRRVVLVVQPHRYSRTAAVGEDLGRAAAAAEVVVVTDVYAASETPVPGVSGRLVADAARAAGAVVRWVPGLGDVVDTLLDEVAEGDLVLVTGAGDVTQVGPQLLARLGDGRG